VRPKNLPEGVTAVPLLMVHGWPGSFYEFYRMIPLLTQPSNPDDIVFEVVCPSIPGYGFSEAPHKKGKWLESCLRLRVTYAQPIESNKAFLPDKHYIQ
jgi:microsomal epoxide hydrolase